jgi:hypothetical protein
VLPVLLRLTESDYPFGICKLFLSFFFLPLCCQEGQAAQWLNEKGQVEFEDTKGVIRFRKSKKDGQHNGKKKKGQEEFEDTKGVIRFVNRRRTGNTMAKRKKDKKSFVTRVIRRVPLVMQELLTLWKI